MTENLVFHDKSKHIEIRYHYICDRVQRGAIKLQYVRTNEQVADVLTKPLSRAKFEHFQDKLGISVTKIGKMGRSDRFTGLTGSNRTFKPLLTGSVQNW
jgi:hypothetical protein